VTKRPQENLELIKRVLGNDYLQLEIKRLSVDEDFESDATRVKIETVQVGADQTVVVEGDGCGVVDAMFVGLQKRYAVEYPSLKSIELSKFTLDAALDTKHGKSGVDALGTVSVEVRNSEGKVFSFADQSRSIVRASARALLALVEYFVNAERAFILLYKARKDAQERRRTDLITRFTQELAEVVKSTSYTDVIEQIKKEII
jgi:hypothetical protein